ncbi:four helix bundle protein [Taibaiella soli]|uniref:Four helix bundle protein n=1 Tax=Taibaiella soli TaxID=1649169 RepID=A0A2W2BE14_9BACT|nr:four helix bundle protein [Taibaiella soli]PZF74509.1 four helix bundle protein [Taibaiella soli]
MTPQELRERLKSFAYRSVRVCESMPNTVTSQIISKQLLRSALSSAANYRAATRAQSKKQFLSKLNIALEEIDESSFWLDAIKDLEIIHVDKLSLLLEESVELTKILSATKNTTVKNLKAEFAKQS